MLDRHHLNIVREVERMGSITAAATALHLTQSALSHAMKRLENDVGTAIWLREGRSLHLTQAGQHMLEMAEHILPQFEHAERTLRDYALGARGALRIGMECHPCYQWLLKIVERYMPQWPAIEIDVKQKFRFGGLSALQDYDIDLLVTPDPTPCQGLQFEPVFNYEQVLVVSKNHALAGLAYVEPEQLCNEVLLTYPVDVDRLDIFTHFLTAANVMPRLHKTLESTDLMLQMVAANRGVAALPRWLVEERCSQVGIVPVRLGLHGVPKTIHLGFRSADQSVKYLRAFIDAARQSSTVKT